MKKPLLIIALCLLAYMVKAQTDSSLDKELSQPLNTLSNSNTIFTATAVMPQFPGGIQKFNKYIADSAMYNGEGTIMAQFIIEKNGSLSDIKIISSLNEAADAECIRLLKNCPKWLPGMQMGIPVRVIYAIPVRFETH